MPTASTGWDGAWALASGVVDGQPLVLSADSPVTLYIDGTEASGRSACNSYSGLVEIDGGQAMFSGLGGTEMGCEPAVMALEAAYLGALGAVSAAAMDGDRLVLSGDGTELTFSAVVPVEPAALIGTVWVLDTVQSGAGPDSSASSPAGERATLEFGDDGAVAGSTGCRTFGGAYVIQGATVDFDQFAMGDELCASDVVAQDSLVTTVLGDGFTADVKGDQLTASDPGGSALVYRAEPPGQPS